MKIIKTYNETDASGVWKVTEFDNGIKSRGLITPSAAYLLARSNEPISKSPEEIIAEQKTERDAKIDALDIGDDLKEFLKE